MKQSTMAQGLCACDASPQASRPFLAPRSLRLHEAGHAVAAVLVGIPVREIRFDGGDHPARVILDGMPSPWATDIAHVEAGLMVRIAGPVADSIAGGFDALGNAWAALDWGPSTAPIEELLLWDAWWVRDYLKTLTQARTKDDLWQALQPYRARAFRLLADHWGSVERIADELGEIWRQGNAMSSEQVHTMISITVRGPAVHRSETGLEQLAERSLPT